MTETSLAKVAPRHPLALRVVMALQRAHHAATYLTHLAPASRRVEHMRAYQTKPELPDAPEPTQTTQLVP